MVGSVVSLLYETVYSSVSCARFERELGRVREKLLVLYDCLLQIIIVEFPTLSCMEFGSLTFCNIYYCCVSFSDHVLLLIAFLCCN